MWIVESNKTTDRKRNKNIEEQEMPEDSANCLGDVLARVLGFASSDCDELNTSV
jgi:hypothetical protein